MGNSLHLVFNNLICFLKKLWYGKTFKNQFLYNAIKSLTENIYSQIISASEPGSSKAEEMGGRHRKCPIYFPNTASSWKPDLLFTKWGPKRGKHNDITILSYSEEQELEMDRVEKQSRRDV